MSKGLLWLLNVLARSTSTASVPVYQWMRDPGELQAQSCRFERCDAMRSENKRISLPSGGWAWWGKIEARDWRRVILGRNDVLRSNTRYLSILGRYSYLNMSFLTATS